MLAMLLPCMGFNEGVRDTLGTDLQLKKGKAERLDSEAGGKPKVKLKGRGKDHVVTQIPTLASSCVCLTYAESRSGGALALRGSFALWHLRLNACPPHFAWPRL